MAEQLHTIGLNLTADALRMALSRWRKRTPASNMAAPSTVSAAAAPPAPGSSGGSVSQRTSPEAPDQPPSGRITSKADLVRLRKSTPPIDLTQLAELGRKK